MTLSDPRRAALQVRALEFTSARTGFPPLAQTTFPACCAPYPGGLKPVRASVASRSMLPSPMSSRVGVHVFTFEACSGFTRVTACWVAQPPEVAFVTRLRLDSLPNQAACQLPDLPTTICVGLPPTGDLRSWGALHIPASNVSFNIFFLEFPCRTFPKALIRRCRVVVL